MAQAGKKQDKTAIRQKQAEHFSEVMKSAQEIIDDPDSTPEEVTDAEQTVKDMMSNLERLNTKYGISPAGGTTPPPTV